MRITKLLNVIFLMFIVIACSGVSDGYVQKLSKTKEETDLAALQLTHVQVESQGIQRFFSKIALDYDIPIGLEVAQGDNELATYQAEFEHGTLRELLTLFVAQHKEYSWEIKYGVVSVFPKAQYRDRILSGLLNTEISHFSIKERTGCMALEQLLVSTPEIKGVLETNGLAPSGSNFSGSYLPQVGKHFTLEASNMTLKSILNRVVKGSPVAKIWIIKHYGYDETVSIRLNAKLEDSVALEGEMRSLP